MAWPITGIVEGFYGPPWSWDERCELMRFCSERGMTHYVYAPKDDPSHRQRWREPHSPDALDGLARLVDEGTLRVGYAIAPGLSIDYRSERDRRSLLAKVRPVLDIGVELVVLAFDDVEFGGEAQGFGQAGVAAWLCDRWGDGTDVAVVPTEYAGTYPTPYLSALAAGLPTTVAIAWTGATVVPAEISAAQADARAIACSGRAPLLWDNAAANDGVMADRLPLGPVRGRDPAVMTRCCGYLLNPTVQAGAARPALAAACGWLRGEDAERAWGREVDTLGVRALAEACDGAVPAALVARAATDMDGPGWASTAAELRRWLVQVAGCDGAGLGPGVAPWVDQARAEAAVGLGALGLVELGLAGQWSAGIEAALALGTKWQQVRRAAAVVMGERCSLVPALGPRPDGTWSLMPESLVEDRNAIDSLVRAAFGSFSSRSRR
ncbi:MAG: beta-N-acetylglucosaminidase domain-containing protein [Acidimicrobiia bacterium]